MQHDFNERRSLLVQDIREFTTCVFPKLIEIYNDLLSNGKVTVGIVELYYWILCELTSQQYSYQIRNHSQDIAFKIPYDHIRNVWNTENFALETLFCFYVKGPALYVQAHDVSVSLSPGCSDIIFTFYWSEAEFMKMQHLLSH